MSEIDSLQLEIDRLKKETEKLDAQRANVAAQKGLTDAQVSLAQTATTSSQEVTDLQTQKALLDAKKGVADSQKALDQASSPGSQQLTDLQNQKAVADAQKQLADSQTQATLAKYIGDVKAGPYSGSVDMKDKAGTEEALLLAARAVKECAKKVAEEVKAKAGSVKKFYIFGAKEFPNFQRLLTFRFRKQLIQQAFTSAGILPPADGAGIVAAPMLAAAGLDAFAKILGFVKTDYTIGSIEAKIDESLLLFSVAGCLEGEVHLPLIYEPLAKESTVDRLIAELAQLVNLRVRAATELAQMKDPIAEAEKKAADPANEEPREQLLAKAKELKMRVDQLNGVVALYDAFAAYLTTADTTGAVPLTGVALELAIETALKSEAAVLLLRLENSGGGFLLKKNLWTGIGAMPLFHMGGATVTYVLLSGQHGQVLAGNVIPVYGGFVRTDQLRDTLAGKKSTAS